MISVIEHIDQVTPEWLTYALRKSGYLQQGEVKAFSKDQSHVEGLTSERYHLELVYSENGPESAPDHLFLKIGKPEHFESCKKEIEFYRLAKEFQTELPFLTCYDSSYSSDSKQSYVLLQNLSKTHFGPDFTKYRFDPEAPFPLTRSECEEAIECLATVHASWWNDPRLGNEIGDRTSKESFNQFIKYLEDCMNTIFDELGERVSAKRRLLYESALSSYPDLIGKYIDSGAPLTLIHGDAFLGNFMFPLDPGKDKVVLLDWQAWRVDVGITDLAHMMALNWHPNQRRIMEKDLLVYYHNHLVKRGVINYGWDECWLGYRIQAIWMLLNPILWFSSNFPLDFCWTFMEKSYAAFQDLQCIELLDN